MLRNNVASTTTFFYPLGNTPAACLTQDLPPRQSANILLLGCGDARNILFTTHVGSGGRLDITCCDIEPAILARNILLFTLLIDDTHATSSDRIWNIYYHLYLDDHSLQLLDSQAEKLLSFSDTLQAWNSGQYGRALRFCDQRTFAKVRSLWAGYSSKHLAPQEKLDRHNRFRATIDKARAAKKQMMGESISMSGVRSAAPTGIQALYDLPNIHNYFWEHGTVNLDESSNKQPKHLNPAFASSPNQALTLHYGLDPLLGFHLATAYAPLTPRSPLCPKTQQAPSIRMLVEAAQLQFCEWSRSFRKSVIDGDTLRFFTGDAIAFCHTLQRAGTTAHINDAHMYCDSWTFQPLKLDAGDYGGSAQLAPLEFDIIDTSNLVDHLGALNVLVAAAPLLADRVTSTLYTEVLVQHESSVQSMVDNILCGHYRTISLLLGLGSVESWTNATAVADVDEGVFNAGLELQKAKLARDSTQSRTRLCWKKLSALSSQHSALQNSANGQSTDLKFDPQDMSRLLHSTYQAMFCHEDIKSLMSNMMIQGIQKLSNPYYNRASFAALLKHVRSNVIVDWDKTLNLFRNVLEEDVSPVSVSRNYLQELNLYLHICGLHTVQVLQDGAPKLFAVEAAKHLSSWDQVPSVLCITFEVPRAQLRPITEKSLSTLGTPSLCCTVQSSRTASRQWANNFSAVQVAFGNIDLQGNKNDAGFHIDVREDQDSWAGKSPLVVSFFIPTWILLQEPQTALVACELQSTPHAAVAFGETLGPELRIFETTLGDDDKIHITRFMPHMVEYPIFVAGSNEPRTPFSSAPATFNNTLSANLAADGRQIVSLTCRIDFFSITTRTKLSDKSSVVELNWISPMIVEVVVAKVVRREAYFPVPVSGSRCKLRIARKSSYVEVIAPVLLPLDTDASPDFMFPLSLMSKVATPGRTPVNWNMPYLTLDAFPTLDIKKTSKLQWLITHASLMFSSRERKIREARMAGQASSTLRQDDRVDFKDGVFSLFMHSTGLQGGQAKVFALHKADAGGVHVLLFVSSVKLDLANHTVILDTAVLPLSHKMTTDGTVQKFLGGLQSNAKVCTVNVTEKELRLWKQILPALAERCRTWEHKVASCEYLSTGEIPPQKGLEDGNVPLCSCGNGQLPQNFMGDLKMPHLEYVLQKYATRIAISPFFAVPYVEECFLRDMPRSIGGNHDSESSLSPGRQQCNACGSDKKKAASGGTSEALLTCTRCKVAKYCSKECQKADWKEHKAVCAPL